MLHTQLKYAPFLLSLLLYNCNPTKKEVLIPNSVSISWAMQKPTAYQSSTKMLKSDHIPDSVFKMTWLRSLAVTGMDCDYGDRTSCWMIREIPAEIAQLSNLQSLILNVNSIVKIPPAIKVLKNLRLLDLSDNPGLSDIEQVTALPNLENLFLYGCNMSALPADIKKLTSLKVLGLTGNNFSETELTRIKKALPGCKVLF